MTHQTARGLASLGRHGDTMLVHMNPEEVQGLAHIAKLQGTKLTINPETGMPEAFSLGSFFKSLLPTIAGMGISAMFPGASPWLIGTLAGVGTTLATGNPLAGIMTGLGVGGGMGIGKGIFNVGEGLAETAGSQVSQSVAANEAAKLSGAAAAGEAVSPFVNNPTMIAQQANAAAAMPSYAGATGAFNNPAFNTATMQAPTSAVVGQNLSTFGKGAAESFNSPSKLITELGGNSQAAFKVGTPLAGAAYSGYTGDLNNQIASTPEQKKININDPLYLNQDTRLRLLAIGGPIQATSGSSVYGNLDGTIAQQTPKDDYGIGRLNNLASAQSINQASLTGYAMGGLTSLKPGGYLSGGGDGMSDSIPATIEGKQPARLADGEFVVPADVVSHIGNGSSKAGSKRLYDMLHKVRKARTGTARQGKQIKPEQFMPA